MKNILLGKIIILATVILFVGCKKDLKDIDPPPRPGGDGTRTAAQQVLDSVYSKYKYLSYWESSIEVANPISTLTDKYDDADALLGYLMSQTPQKTNYIYHPSYNGPMDRFSWIEDLSSDSDASSRADVADGYGLYMAFDGDRQDSLFVMFVEGGSPGERAGIKRGDRVLEMEGDKNMVYANQSKVDEYIERKTLNITVQSINGTKKTHNLNYDTYDIQPFMLGKVFTDNSTKVGYIALSSFEELRSGGSDSKMKKGIDSTFTVFGAQQVKKLIVDLRYNGGGYVSSAIYLLNKIINSSGDKKIMFKYDVNKNLERERNEGSTEFVDEIFARDNNGLEVTDVVFLVSDYTASASEIVISALMPYMKVQLVGYEKSTYGKPVGFFREDISDDVGLWAASFKIINAQGFTDYWDGITANFQANDNIHKLLGDPSEDMTQKGLSLLGASNARASARVTSSVKTNRSQIRELNKIPRRNMIKD